jgi:arginyl-tRNA--protein-N-Asp/Glu arginylyltransferase
MQYLNFGTADLDLNDSESVKRYYNQGYVMTRLNPGHMEKVRSIRINLKEYFESSENRRIVKKFNHIIE